MAALCICGALRTTPNDALNANLAGMDRAKSAAIRLRDTGLQHDKSIPKITDLFKSIEYSHTPFEALIPDREEWEQGRPGTTGAICFYRDGSKLEAQVGGGVYSE